MPLTLEEYKELTRAIEDLEVKAYDTEHRGLIQYGAVIAEIDKHLKLE